MVEFVLVAPAFLLVLLGVVVTGIVVMNIIAVNNAVRDIARASAVCGSLTDGSNTSASLPDGRSCTSGNLQSYADQQLGALHAGAVVGSVQVTVVNPTATTNTTVGSGFGSLSSACVAGQNQVKIHVTYSQPLYIPLVGLWLGSNGSTTSRQLDGTAEATCER
jgi:Flp pilus assembly protein TadG